MYGAMRSMAWLIFFSASGEMIFRKIDRMAEINDMHGSYS
jgi:hypothetical protein